jgi:hypothetical protein
LQVLREIHITAAMGRRFVHDDPPCRCRLIVI